MSRETIRARLTAATPELGSDAPYPLDLRAYWVFDGGSREVGDFLYPVHDDVRALLAVADAAAAFQAGPDVWVAKADQAEFARLGQALEAALAALEALP